MKLSIIIPTHNEEDYLPNLLNSIDRQNFHDYEVIIADANSTDKTRKIALEHDTIVIDGGLPAIGRNRGASIANGELLLFLDADSVLTDDYIKTTITEFEHRNLGIAITQIIPLEKGFINEFSHGIANFMTKKISNIKPHGAGCYGILTYKLLHDNVNGFDEELDFGEDTDYIERIGKISRFKVLDEPRLLVSTRRLEEEGLAQITYKYARSTAKQMAGKKVTLNELDYSFDHKNNNRKLRIIYSLCGEGMGHAIRSAMVIEYLIKEDYELVVFASDRAYKYLNKKFDNIHEISGFNTVYDNNVADYSKTFVNNMKDVPIDLRDNLNKMYKIAKNFKPDLVISDFEFYANLLAHIINVPLLSIDNQHVLTEAKYDVDEKYALDKLTSQAVVHAFIQRPNKILIYSYFHPPIRNNTKTEYVDPLIREDIYQLKPRVKDYILIYQTSQSNTKMFDLLKKTDYEYIVYGFNKDEKDENILYREFSEKQLYEDFKDARCVITNGGFSFISEALQLEKPILSIPVKKQFEQILNAIYIEKLGYGKYYEELSVENLEYFIAHCDEYRINIQEKYNKHTDNSETLETLKKTIDEIIS
ncbi:MAG: glycosyltransferase [Methanosphaera sp.]|nr:glycosyltransferase [Methanosphaera sp.]